MKKINTILKAMADIDGSLGEQLRGSLKRGFLGIDQSGMTISEIEEKWNNKPGIDDPKFKEIVQLYIEAIDENILIAKKSKNIRIAAFLFM